MRLPFPQDDLFDVFPVPVDIIAKCYYGIEVHRRYLPDSIGAILHKLQGRAYLYVNAGHSHERQRYSIAHELAHHHLHPLGVYLAGPGATSVSEKAADMIAADILMPKKEVRRILNRGAIFDEMVKHFGVSKEAMRFRVDEVAKEEKQRTMKRGEIVEDRARSYGQAEGEQGRHAEADGLPMTPGDRV